MQLAISTHKLYSLQVLAHTLHHEIVIQLFSQSQIIISGISHES